ncbi:MAG TPA: hypothetical protein VGO55_10330 [Allosphingosinicella sp.]|nr:hypothetical protein [Allosphingosinicella sp.]
MLEAGGEMPNPTIEEAVSAYASQRPKYETFASELLHLLRSLLESRGLRAQTIEVRAKSIESFREKIGRSGKNYEDPLTEIPDLCGCRIIAYYGNDVRKISEIIKEEFDVVEEELSHQPAQLEADRFGYLSLHYVIKMNQQRHKLPEWSAYKALHAEVQIRTVIQHAWSAVSHALQYKQETSIPSALQRRLYRIASLFELADEEFVAIREQRAALGKAAADVLSTGHGDLAITPTSLAELIKSWREIPKIETAVAEAGFSVTTGIAPDDPYTAEIYKLAEHNGIKTIDELQSALTPPKIEIFGGIFSKLGRSEWSGNTDFFLFLLLAAKFPDDAPLEIIESEGWRDPIKGAVAAALDELR